MQAQNAVFTEQYIPLITGNMISCILSEALHVCVCINTLTCGLCMNTHNVQVYTT